MRLSSKERILLELRRTNLQTLPASLKIDERQPETLKSEGYTIYKYFCLIH